MQQELYIDIPPNIRLINTFKYEEEYIPKSKISDEVLCRGDHYLPPEHLLREDKQFVMSLLYLLQVCWHFD